MRSDEKMELKFNNIFCIPVLEMKSLTIKLGP